MHELRFLAYVDLLGTTYSASTLATGYGAYIAVPILRNEVEGRENTLTEEEALGILEKCMRSVVLPRREEFGQGIDCAVT
jgi:20S proteasome alpha/beta subunit